VKKLHFTFICIIAVLFSLILIGCNTGSTADSDLDSAAPPPPADNSNAKLYGDYKKGSSTRTGFESKYLNLKFSAPEGYIMASASDLEGLVEFSGDILYTDQEKKTIDFAKARIVYEMIVASPNGTPTITVAVEKLPMGHMTAEQYLDEFTAALKSQFEKKKITEHTISDEKTSVEFAKQSFLQISATVKDKGEEVKQDFLVRKYDDRMLVITVSYTVNTKNNMDTLLNRFSEV
jgi:hypothetical protein